MNSLIRPALYESFHDIQNLSHLEKQQQLASVKLDDSDYKVFDVVGPICETGDVLGHDRELPTSTKPNDVILIDCAGAYGRVMSSSYNRRQPAHEITVEW